MNQVWSKYYVTSYSYLNHVIWPHKSNINKCCLLKHLSQSVFNENNVKDCIQHRNIEVRRRNMLSCLLVSSFTISEKEKQITACSLERMSAMFVKFVVSSLCFVRKTNGTRYNLYCHKSYFAFKKNFGSTMILPYRVSDLYSWA